MSSVCKFLVMRLGVLTLVENILGLLSNILKSMGT